MAIKRLGFLFAFVTISNLLWAQPIEIKLSLEETNKSVFLREVSNIIELKECLLIVSIRNKTDSNYFIPKFSHNDLIPINAEGGVFAMLHADAQLRQGSTMGLHTYFQDRFLLKFHAASPQDNIDYGWNVEPQNDRTDLFRIDISVLNNIIELQNFLNKFYPQKEVLFFNDPEKKSISYKTALSLREQYLQDDMGRKVSDTNSYIFLEPNMEFKYTISLLPFNILGGTYDFLISQDAENKNNVPKVLFPNSDVSAYYRYTNPLQSNQICITFKRKEDLKIIFLGEK